MNKLLLLNFALFVSSFSFSQVNDVGALENEILISPYSGASSLIYDGFSPGLNVYNFGSADQDSVMVNAKIDGPGGNIYNDTIGPLAINSGDTVSIFPGNAEYFPEWSQGIGSYTDGEYTLTYTIYISGIVDVSSSDNLFTSYFKIQEERLSLARLDGADEPKANIYPSNSSTEYQSCMMIQEPNLSELCIVGLYFIPHTDTSINDLAGAEIFVNLYDWDDPWTDLNDTSYTFDTITNDAFQNLNLLAFGMFYPNSNDEVDDVAYADFNLWGSSQLLNNHRYLVCLQTFESTTISFGYDSVLTYDGNSTFNAQPISPIHIDGGWHINGWNNLSTPSIALRVVPYYYCIWNVDEAETLQASVFPNPANDMIEVSINSTGIGTLEVMNLSGKIIQSNNVSFTSGPINIDLSAFKPGLYLFKIELENGESTQTRVIKN